MRRRFIDNIFFIYFTSHIGISIFFDSQVYLPSWMYPAVFRDLLNKYCTTMKDPLLLQAPTWYEAFLLCEFFLQFPFFFVAAYAYWKGVKSCPWIRLPIVIYATHTATTLLPILYHILNYDFRSLETKKLRYAGPVTPSERYLLATVYSPYLLTPLVMLADALTSTAYKTINETPQTGLSRKTN
ncbi:sigma intracellular receptor 2 [Octopus bimaculoides]|uniref:Sigma intracellular receptor 2 n=1 Tax=Octopus bimaculoides TaxID=37653 RepID=A0A0L8G6U1_OCTBM|nr:sigma intracellular receptor 2 [Octopus bimaculoides]|eukprot:XP_014783862.1 PREDICTED: transmembrane protein 97-like [Octopus bimaculoides]